MASNNKGSRPQRYRAGQTPSTQNATNNDTAYTLLDSGPRYIEEESGKSTLERRLERLAQTSSADASGDRTRRRAHRAEVIVAADDLNESSSRVSDAPVTQRRAGATIEFDQMQAPQHHEQPRQTGEDMDLDEEQIDERRARLRSILLERQAERRNDDEGPGAAHRARSGTHVAEDDEEGRYDGEEEEEEEEEEDDEDEVVTIRPTFVKKSQRATLKDEETLAKELAEAQEREAAAEELRKQQTKEMLAAEDEREEEAKMDLVDGMIEDIEKLDDPDAEFELWKERELARLKRDKEAELRLDAEREGVEERKNLSDEQVMKERRAAEREARERGEAPDETEGPKSATQRKTMQRYYHKGAFFQDEMQKLSKTHDWDAPTGEDNWFNRTSELDSVKYKKYGSSAKYKSSSLRDQDTTRRNSPPMHGTEYRKRPREYYDDRGYQRDRRSPHSAYDDRRDYDRDRRDYDRDRRPRYDRDDRDNDRERRYDTR